MKPDLEEPAPEESEAAAVKGDPVSDLDDEELLERAGNKLDLLMSAAESVKDDSAMVDTPAGRIPKLRMNPAPAEPSEPIVILDPTSSRRVDIYREAEDDPDLIQEELFAAEAPDAELLDRAARILLTARRPMPSLLQRHLGLSFAEARQILGYMQQLGAVAEPSGSGPWEALIDLSAWEAQRSE